LLKRSWWLLCSGLLLLGAGPLVLGALNENVSAVRLVRAMSQVGLTELSDKHGLLWRLPLSGDFASRAKWPVVTGKILCPALSRLVPQTAHARLSRGRELVWNGEYIAAAQLLRNGATDSQNRLLTTWLLGNALWYSGSRDSARELWRTSGLAVVYVWRCVQPAQSAFKAGGWERSIALLFEALDIDPVNAYAFYLLGQNYEALQRFADAIIAYRRAGEFARSGDWFKGPSYAHIGRLWRNRLGSSDAALRAFRQAVRIDPSDGWSQIAIGDIYFEQRRLKESEAAYRRAAYPLPGNATAHWGLGRVSALHANWAEAIREFTIASALEPTTLTFRLALADAYYDDRQFEKARSEYGEILRIEPTNARGRQRVLALAQIH